MQPQQPVIRTYKGRDRRSAEEAYRQDAQSAARASWYPVAHRWTTTWDGHELAVVFELRGDNVTSDAVAAGATGTAEPQVAQYGGAPTYASASTRYAPMDEAPAIEPETPLVAGPAAAAALTSDLGPTEEAAPAAAEEFAASPAEYPAPPDEDAPRVAESEAMPAEEFAAGPAGEYAAGPAGEYAAGPAGEYAAGTAEEYGAPSGEYGTPGVGSPAPAEFGAPAESGAPGEELAPGPAEEEAAPPGAILAASAATGGSPDGSPARTAAELAALSAAAAGAAATAPEPTGVAGPQPPATLSAAAGPPPVAPPRPMSPLPGTLAAPGPSGQAAQPLTAAQAHARAVMHAVDLHCAGEPLRLIRSGFPTVPFAPILERRSWVREHADAVRRALIFEPRGHRDMYGAILMQPFRSDADVAVLFMHNEGYSTMCGHGVIAIATALVEERLYPVTEPQTLIRLETPAGIVIAAANVVHGAHGGYEVRSVRFQNVPAYLHASGLQVHPDGVQLTGSAAANGALSVDLAFGGAYYGIVNAADLDLRVVPDQVAALTAAGAAITDVLRRDHTPTHPTDPDLGFVYGTIIVDEAPATAPDGRAPLADLRNVTIFADAEVDRSPCGSGTSALLAQRFAQGRVAVGRDIVNAGITGESFRARVESPTTLGDRDAVITTVEGTAFVTGYHTFLVDGRDPLGGGFLLR